LKRYRISDISNTAKVFIGLSAAGVGIAGYHSYDEIVHYSTKVSNACHVSSVVNCAGGFAYSHLFGIPLYVFGIVWFPLLLIVSVVMRREFLGTVMLPLLMVGNLFTIYLWYLEIDVVYKNTGTICPVCVSMYVVNYILTAIVGIKLYRSL
jgi:uncharacterized membrane protein